MSLPSYIVRRQGSRNFYVRMPIPKDLQQRLGTPGKPRRERWMSLNTSDPQKARRDGRPIIEGWEREFAELRRPRELTETELQNAIWKRYLELVTADDKFRLSLPTEDDLKQIWAHLEGEFGGAWDLEAFRAFEVLQNEFREDQQARVTRLRMSALVLSSTAIPPPMLRRPNRAFRMTQSICGLNRRSVSTTQHTIARIGKSNISVIDRIRLSKTTGARSTPAQWQSRS
jgi:hypothetical protein